MIGTIELKLEGATLVETEHYRQMINALFVSGALNVKNGSAILHFDHLGDLQEIEVHSKKWRKPKKL